MQIKAIETGISFIGDQAAQQGVPWPPLARPATKRKRGGGHRWKGAQMCWRQEANHSVWLRLQVSRSLSLEKASFPYKFTVHRISDIYIWVVPFSFPHDQFIQYSIYQSVAWSINISMNTSTCRSNCETFCNLILFNQPVSVQAPTTVGPVRGIVSILAFWNKII